MREEGWTHFLQPSKPTTYHMAIRSGLTLRIPQRTIAAKLQMLQT